MISQLLALQVILPLIIAVICSVINYKRLTWALSFLSVGIVFILSIIIFLHVYENGDLSYAMGGWAPPYGVELKVDLLSCIFTLLISGIMTITMPYCLYVVEDEMPANKIGAFYTCLLLCIAGLLGMVITHDIFNIYVFLELSSLTAYALLGMADKKSAHSAFEYLIIGTVGATFYLFGVGLLYMMTGTLNMSDISSKLLQIQDNLIVNSAIIFIFIGIIIKAALFPFHKWMTNAYSNAPNYIAVVFSALATKVSIYLIIRFTYSLFNHNAFMMTISNTLWLLSIFAIIIPAICAFREHKLPTILPYSSASQIGYIMLGISLNTKLALAAALLHLIFHSVTKSALFMVHKLLSMGISNYLVRGSFIILGCSLIGIPITAGFVSKWYLAMAAIKLKDFFSLGVIIIGSLITALYIWKNIELMAFSYKTQVKSNNIILLLPLLILTIIVLTGGIYSKPLFDIINLAVERLM